MRVISILLVMWALLGSCAVLAADEAKPVAPNTDVEPKAVPKAKKDATIKPRAPDPAHMRTKCWTNVRDCAGRTTYGPFPQAMGCAIWWNDDAGGVRNFTLQPNETHTPENVRYNDTGACVEIRYAPPNYNNGRFYLWVP
jgi:hypothetical protein